MANRTTICINLHVTEREKALIDAYAEQEQRSKSDILREFIRSLRDKIEPA
jgi:hypothetical protein